MKISKLHIDQFRHLENLDFDFTYPEDFHIVEKRGKPLDKICFIGQSATGKTGLLELINEYSIITLNLECIQGFSSSITRNVVKKINGEIKFIFNDLDFVYKNEEVIYNNKIYKNRNERGEIISLIPRSEKNSIIYFKSDLISDGNIALFSTNPINLIEKYVNELANIKANRQFNLDYEILLDGNAKPQIWLTTINEILNYRSSFTKKMSELIQSGLLANVKKLDVEFQKWQKDNPNKLEDFATKFNPLLSKLNLEIDLINPEFAIPIKNKLNDEIIPINNTSSGTKGLLLTFLPLYDLDTKNSIILIDEPERSLYPDMQMDLMEHYQNLAPEAQFIVATHSPFIAASFEPEERFILYFDEKGKVAVRRGSSPIGDDPNDILYNDFGIDYINKHGKEVHDDYLAKKSQLLFEENEEVKKKLLGEIESIGDKYNF